MTIVWDYDYVMDMVWHCKDTVEYSTTLTNWVSLTNVPVLIIDHRGSNWVVRDLKPGFYRVRRDKP